MATHHSVLPKGEQDFCLSFRFLFLFLFLKSNPQKSISTEKMTLTYSLHKYPVQINNSWAKTLNFPFSPAQPFPSRSEGRRVLGMPFFVGGNGAEGCPGVWTSTTTILSP